jgi:hypothetical protein
MILDELPEVSPRLVVRRVGFEDQPIAFVEHPS